MASKADGTFDGCVHQSPAEPETMAVTHTLPFPLERLRNGGEVLKIATVILKKDRFVCFIRQEQTLVLHDAFTLPKVGTPTHSAVTSGGLPRGVQVQGPPLERVPPGEGQKAGPSGRSFSMASVLP